jgi:transposase
MGITSNYNSVFYLKRKTQLLENIASNNFKLKQLEKRNENEQKKWIQEINKIYDEDQTMTMKQLAFNYNVSYSTINRYIWNPRPQGGITKEIIQEINKLYNAGMIMPTVAEKLDLSLSTVSKYVWEPRERGTREDIRQSRLVL